jgi:hypothetical protein
MKARFWPMGKNDLPWENSRKRGSLVLARTNPRLADGSQVNRTVGEERVPLASLTIPTTEYSPVCIGAKRAFQHG